MFTGTQSIAKWARANGYEDVVTLDIDAKSNATHTVDVLDWDYRAAYPPGYFEWIHASVPCTEYSVAKTTAPRNLELADRIVMRTLEILSYFKPTTYTIENPYTGMLRHRPFMALLTYTVVDYCQFHTPDDAFLYKKKTIIFTNRIATLVKPRPLCDGACAGIKANEPGQRGHAVSFGGRRSGNRKMIVSNISLAKKHRLPQGLLTWLMTG